MDSLKVLYVLAVCDFSLVIALSASAVSYFSQCKSVIYAGKRPAKKKPPKPWKYTTVCALRIAFVLILAAIAFFYCLMFDRNSLADILKMFLLFLAMPIHCGVLFLSFYSRCLYVKVVEKTIRRSRKLKSVENTVAEVKLCSPKSP